MATLAEFRAQYPQYDAVPDLTLADSLHEKFYAKIPKMDFYKTIGLGSAAAIPGAENVVTGVKQPEVSMRDRIMGVIETPLALGATLSGAAIAPFVGIAGTLASGKYGTQEGIRAGEEAMKAVQYQPRTQTARQALTAVGEFLQPVTSALPPTLGSAGTTLNALAPASVMQANALARPVVRQVTEPVQNAMTRMMTREQPVMPGVGAASTAEDLMRQQRMEQFGIRATSGERTKNLAQQQFESEVQRGALTGISQDTKTQLAEQMRGFKAGQKEDILNQFERMTNQIVGEEGLAIDRSNPRALGTLVDKTMVNLYTKKFNDYKAKYAKADSSGETLEQVPYQSLLDYIETKSPTRREKLDPILNDVAELLAMNDPQKTGTISIRNLEDIYQIVGTVKDSPSAKPLKDLITQIGDGAGGKLYQEARQARAQLEATVEGLQDKLNEARRATDKAAQTVQVKRNAIKTPDFRLSVDSAMAVALDSSATIKELRVALVKTVEEAEAYQRHVPRLRDPTGTTRQPRSSLIMYNFKMPSKLVQKGQPLPEMPEGIGMEMPSAPSMQPDQTQGIQSMMANYNPPAAPSQVPSFGFYGAMPPSMPSGFGMPSQRPQMGQNGGMNMNTGPSIMGPSFFTL